MNFISFVLFLFTWNIETVIRSSSSWWKWWAEKERKLFTLCLFESSIETYAYTLTKKTHPKKTRKNFVHLNTTTMIMMEVSVYLSLLKTTTTTTLIDWIFGQEFCFTYSNVRNKNKMIIIIIICFISLSKY